MNALSVKINRESQNLAISEFESQISSNSRLSSGKRKQPKRAFQSLPVKYFTNSKKFYSRKFSVSTPFDCQYCQSKTTFN